MKTTQIFAAAIAFGLMASPALAQDDMMKEKVKDEAVKIMADEVKETKDGVMMKGDPIMIETPESKMKVDDGTLMVKPDGEVIMKGDEVTMTPKMEKMKMKDGQMTESWGEDAKMATPAPTPAAAPVNCPSGTTAQPNGTCMITGDYQE